MIYADLKGTFSQDIKITLCDLFPSDSTYTYLSEKTHGGISGISTPVNATDVPSGLKGFRTIFSGFHHFDKDKALEVLKNAVAARQGIAIFDGGNRTIWMILLILAVHPLLLFVCTPFLKPFRLSRLVFTYLIPVIPFCTVWDGIISIIRLYSPDELAELAQKTNPEHYTWISGKVRNKFGMSITYLVGFPETDAVTGIIVPAS
jgi:hypothetical protein